MAIRYWIAPAIGHWNNSINWSSTSGGAGGASVPDKGYEAIFDQGASSCIISTPTTVEKILTSGFHGNLLTVAPLNCKQLEWEGNLLSLATSQIETLLIKRTRVNGSHVCFDPHGSASYARINPARLTWVQKNGNSQTFQWNAIPGAASYHIQWSNNNGVSWSNWSGTVNDVTTTNTIITGTFGGGNWLLRLRANLSAGGVSEWSIILFNTTNAADFTIDFNSTTPNVPGPLDIETLEIGTGSNAITLENQAETRLTGDVTISTGVTVSQGIGSKLVLFGTQDQDVAVLITSSSPPEFSLNKLAGKLKISGDAKLRSDLLRDPGEIDPRTATILDIETEKIHLTGDVACQSCIIKGESTIPTGITLDTYACTIDQLGDVDGGGTIRVHTGQFQQDGTLGNINVVYWNSAAVPPAPSQIFVSGQRPTEIDLWWNTVNGAASYALERTTTYSNPGSWIQIYNGSAAACTDSGLTPGFLYYYRLKAVNSSGDSNWSPMLAAATSTYPAPGNLSVSKVTASSMELQWASQYNPVDHLLARSPNGVDSWTEIQTLSPSSFVFTGLTPETTYYFRVRARYPGVNSPWSQVVSGTTLPLPEPTSASATWSVTKRIAQKFEVKTALFGNKQ